MTLGPNGNTADKQLDEAKSSFQDRAKYDSQYEAGSIIFGWATQHDDCPAWWSLARDEYLRKFWKSETILSGALYTVQSKIKTTGYKVDGPPRQVSYWSDFFANADFGKGWGELVSKFVEDVFTQDNGGWLEITGPGDPRGPLTGRPDGLAHLDAAQIYRTGNLEYPVIYRHPLTGQRNLIHNSRVINVTSMPSPMETMWGVGFCAVSRVLIAARILKYISEFKEEKLGARPYRGILRAQGYQPKQVQDAMKDAEEAANNKGFIRFMPFVILASYNPGVDTALELVDFAGLPDNYNERETIDIYWDILAACFGVDRNEFAPIRSGQLGSGQQSGVQNEKAKAKGVAEVFKEIERQFNWKLLPASTQFAFDNVNDEEDAALADLKTKKAGWINSLVIPADKKIQLYADEGLIPPEWLEEDLTTDITTPDGEQVDLEEESVEDDITQADTQTEPGVEDKQYNPVKLLLEWLESNRLQTSLKGLKSVNEVTNEYRDTLLRYAFDAWAGRMDKVDFARAHRALMRSVDTKAFIEGMREGGISDAEVQLDEDDEKQIEDWLSGQLGFVGDFSAAVVGAKEKPEKDAIRARIDTWVDSLRVLSSYGYASAKQNMPATFAGSDGKESCAECSKYKGQRQRLKGWVKKGLVPGVPGNENFSCKGFNCEHYLANDEGKRLLPLV